MILYNRLASLRTTADDETTVWAKKKVADQLFLCFNFTLLATRPKPAVDCRLIKAISLVIFFLPTLYKAHLESKYSF